jgi:hypothetical protein
VAGFDLAVELTPALVVGATGPADVVAAVRFARAHRLPVGVQATGHGRTSAMAGGLAINTSRAAGVTIDAATRTARLQAGVLWGAVVAAAAEHGLVPLCGSAPGVGAVSYTLGGGLGPFGRLLGYAADRVRGLQVVTADGELCEVTAEQHPELFWAMRGAGANFGVVTELAVELVPMPELYGGGLFFSGEDAEPVLRAFLDCTAGAPDELTLSIAFVSLPDVPVLPDSIRGRHCAHLRVAYAGTQADAERFLGPIRSAATPLLDTVRVMPTTEVGSIHADPTRPMPVSCRSLVLRSIDESVVAALLRHGTATTPYLLEVRQLGGALAREPQPANPVGHRGGVANVFTTVYPSPAGPAVAEAGERELYAALEPCSDGGSLVTFLAGVQVTTADVRAAHSAADYARLAALKATWDPDNMFRFNQNIPPA